jgi:hypothetical protein
MDSMSTSVKVDVKNEGHILYGVDYLLSAKVTTFFAPTFMVEPPT